MPEKPVLLDANAVLRYLLEDNDEQADEVCQAVASGTRVAESLGLLLDDVACQRRGIALAALGLWSGSRFDFVDCVLAAEHAELGRDVLTFDKKLLRLLEKVE